MINACAVKRSIANQWSNIFREHALAFFRYDGFLGDPCSEFRVLIGCAGMLACVSGELSITLIMHFGIVCLLIFTMSTHCVMSLIYLVYLLIEFIKQFSL